MPRIRMRDRRAALVDAALKVMDRQGLFGTTTRAVVAEADMSLASFHYAFTSRDELLTVVITQIIAEIDQNDWPMVDVAASDEALVVGLTGVLDAQLSDRGRATVLAELNTGCLRSPELAPIGLALTAARRRAMTRWAERWASAWGRTWVPTVDQVARLVLGALDGIVAQWLVDDDTEAARTSMIAFGRSLAGLTQPRDAPGSSETGAA